MYYIQDRDSGGLGSTTTEKCPATGQEIMGRTRSGKRRTGAGLIELVLLLALEGG